KQIKQLEERYKIALIEGSRPPLSLTPAGLALFERAEVLFGAAHEIDSILGADDVDGLRILRLGTEGPAYAAEFLAGLTRRVPDLQYRVTVANAVNTTELLTSAQIDLGIIGEPMIQPDYTYVPLFIDRLVAIVPSAWTGVPNPVPLSWIIEQAL